jgi:carbamoyl-phosphate synthase large subunit
MIQAVGLPVEMVTKRLEEGHPNVEDVIREGLVHVVINTPQGGQASVMRDGFQIRRAAAEKRIPCFTSLDTARAAVDALVHGHQHYSVQPLREYLADRQADLSHG